MNITPDKAKISSKTFDEFLAMQGDLEFCEAAAIAAIIGDKSRTRPQSPDPKIRLP